MNEPNEPTLPVQSLYLRSEHERLASTFCSRIIGALGHGGVKVQSYAVESTKWTEAEMVKLELEDSSVMEITLRRTK